MSSIVKEFLIPGTNKGLFYGGQFRASTSGSEITVLDPARGIPFTPYLMAMLKTFELPYLPQALHFPLGRD